MTIYIPMSKGYQLLHNKHLQRERMNITVDERQCNVRDWLKREDGKIVQWLRC